MRSRTPSWGSREVVESLLLAMIADGHVLFEGPPGLAKTLACRCLAAALEGEFKRVQFTPDLLPADIVGTRIFDQREAAFTTVLGPIFANVLLADEINRAPAKVQSALLEAMQERQVTIGPQTHPLPEPFIVLATMNPLDCRRDVCVAARAARPLSAESQRRFSRTRRRARDPRSVCDGARPFRCAASRRSRTFGHGAQQARNVHVDEKIKRYVVDLVFATRSRSRTSSAARVRAQRWRWCSSRAQRRCSPDAISCCRTTCAARAGGAAPPHRLYAQDRGGAHQFR